MDFDVAVKAVVHELERGATVKRLGTTAEYEVQCDGCVRHVKERDVKAARFDEAKMVQLFVDAIDACKREATMREQAKLS
jgi:hypothetical protein